MEKLGTEAITQAWLDMTNIIERELLFCKIALASNCTANAVNDVEQGCTLFPIKQSLQIDKNYLIKHNELGAIKDAFNNNVILHSLCSIFEGFYCYIDDLLYILRIAQISQSRKIKAEDFQEVRSKIKNSKYHFKDKLSDLLKDFQCQCFISYNFRQYFDFLEGIRHCVTHNLSIVSENQFKTKAEGGKAARIEWLDVKLIQNTPTARLRAKSMDCAISGHLITTTKPIGIDIISVVKELPYGSQIRFTFDELDIMSYMFYFFFIEQLRQQAIKYLDSTVDLGN